jgi:hypothetical protein
VYYWRTRFANPRENEDTAWVVNSFTVAANSGEGWSQSTADHFINSTSSSEGIQFDQNGNQSFIETSILLSAFTGGAADPSTSPSIGTSIQVDGTEFLINPPTANTRLCRDNTLLVMAFNQANLVPYAALPEPDGTFDVLFPPTCGRTPQVVNNFTANDISVGLLDSALQRINEGDPVLVMNINRVNYSSFSSQTLDLLGELGVTRSLIQSLADGDPYLFLGRKGQNNPILELIPSDPAIPDSVEQLSFTNEQLQGRFSSGSIQSLVIGPARSWDRLFTRTEAIDNGDGDVFSFNLFGIGQDGQQTLIEGGITSAETDLQNISPTDFPFLQLEFITSDEINLSPRQLRAWFVSYQGVPEGVVLKPNREGGNALAIEKQEGEVFSSEFVFRNVSTNSFTDSLEVVHRLFNTDSRTSEIMSFAIAPVQAEGSQGFSIDFETLGKSGNNDLTVAVNSAPDELERTSANNAGSIPGFLSVQPDEINPVIDVTFDGRYILDGDIVSPNPLIAITLKDENEFILKEDTTGIRVFLKGPAEEAVFEPVFFEGNDEIEFIPATEENDVKVNYNPQGLADGLYALRVEAEDASSNEAGSIPYEISFEVINASQITHFYPYPNPFSTSCRFVFTLTGSEIPDQVKIQIMTVSGKIVREITQDEIGTIRIGNNMTEYAWDGRDEYGDKLANGVYLYRVFIQNQGQGIERRTTSADRAFKRGYGKLYILR